MPRRTRLRQATRNFPTRMRNYVWVFVLLPLPLAWLSPGSGGLAESVRALSVEPVLLGTTAECERAPVRTENSRTAARRVEPWGIRDSWLGASSSGTQALHRPQGSEAPSPKYWLRQDSLHSSLSAKALTEARRRASRS